MRLLPVVCALAVVGGSADDFLVYDDVARQKTEEAGDFEILAENDTNGTFPDPAPILPTWSDTWAGSILLGFVSFVIGMGRCCYMDQRLLIGGAADRLWGGSDPQQGASRPSLAQQAP